MTEQSAAGPDPHPTDGHEVAPDRHARRPWVVGSVAAAVVAVAVAVALAGLPDPDPAAREAYVSLSVPSASPTSTPAATPSAAVSPTGGAVSPAASTPGARPAGSTGAPRPASTTHRPQAPAPARTSTTKPAATPLCGPTGTVDVRQLYTNGQVTVTARRSGSSKPLCLGERIRVFWASYTSGADGVSHLYQSQSHYLDRDHPSWTMTIIVPAKCGSSWYIGRDNPAVPTTFAKGVVPFGSHKIYWDNDSYRC